MLLSKFAFGGPNVVVTLTSNAKLTLTKNINGNLFGVDKRPRREKFDFIDPP